MTCRVESNATFQASDPDRRELLGYKGGNLQCPKRDECDGIHCKFDNENFRTIQIIQKNLSTSAPSRIDRFYSALEKHFDIVEARE